MPRAVRQLTPGEVVIGFIRPSGELIGDLVDAAIGHDVHAYTLPGLRAQLISGHAIAVTIGKAPDGTIRVFGSGAFPAPGGALSPALKELARRLVS